MGNEIDRYRLEPRNTDDAWQIAKIAAQSGLYNVQRPEQALVIIMTGTELGLTVNQALRSIQVVKGKPNLSADLIVALVKRSELCESWEVVESTNTLCTIETKRVTDKNPRRLTWTLEDAKRAGINGDMYTKYPRQMLRHRCSADLAREVYPDLVLGLYAPEEFGDARDLIPEAVSISPGKGGSPAVDGQEEQVDPQVPPILQRVMESIKDLGGKDLTAEQAAAVWTDHYEGIVAANLQERAGELLELALGPKLKTRFKELLRKHESKIAEAKRAEHERTTLEVDIKRIRAAATLGDLETVKKSLGGEKSNALSEYLWIRRVELSTSVGDLMQLAPRARETIKNETTRERVLAAISKRQRELQGPPDDGGPDGGERAPASHVDAEAAAEAAEERAAIANESSSGDQLAKAIERLRATQGPTHAIRHYLAHRGELSPSEQPRYRESLLSWLPNRYPKAIATREAAEAELAEAESASVVGRAA